MKRRGSLVGLLLWITVAAFGSYIFGFSQGVKKGAEVVREEAGEIHCACLFHEEILTTNICLPLGRVR